MIRSRRVERIRQQQQPAAPVTSLTWLDRTDFARYALVPEQLVPEWTGGEADEVIGEYAGAVRCAGHDVLVLGGEPLAVTWLPEHLLFARWISADDDTSLLAGLEPALASDAWEDVVTVELGGRYVLTDAAYDGEHILGLDDTEQQPELIRLELPAGRYRVQSLLLEPDPESSFQLERLLPSTSARS
ncbi:Imm21 family immunity protein [Kitasatospora sp. NPDC051853]|uniref:Imm21 family immunity protein n=1 Tax=Kitasatospora sp. NPDC051853 TaxID=3364058 RepID=UPI0037B67BF9